MLKHIKIDYKSFIPIVCSFISIVILSILISFNRDFKVTMISDVINAGDDYKNTFTATFRGYNVTDKVKIESNIYDTSLGKYQLTFRYINNGKEYFVVKNVEIKDLDAPNIYLRGGKEVVLKLNSQYNEKGYSAVDNYDANISDKVVVSGNVDTLKTGVYKLVYTVKDSSNNEASVTRKIHVLEKLPTEMSEDEFSLDGLFNNVILKEKKSVTDKTMKKYTYIGDEDISLYSTYGLLDIKNVWYNKNISLNSIDNTSVIIDGIDTKKNIYENVLAKKPKTIIVSFGLRSFDNIDNFVNKYEEIVTKLKNISDSRIVVISVSSVLNNNKYSMKTINDINYYLAEMCSRNDIEFIYTNDSIEHVSDDYLSDGVTLSKKGVTALYEYIKSHIRKGD